MIKMQCLKPHMVYIELIIIFIFMCISSLCWGQSDYRAAMQLKKDPEKILDIKEIFSFSNVARVTLVISDESKEYQWNMSESELMKNGCNYFTNDLKKINEILEILKNSKIEAIDGATIWSLRAILYLKMKNESKIKISFGSPYSIFTPIIFNGKTLVANNSLLNDFYGWSKKINGNSNCNH